MFDLFVLSETNRKRVEGQFKPQREARRAEAVRAVTRRVASKPRLLTRAKPIAER